MLELDDAPEWLVAVTAAEDPERWEDVARRGVFAGIWPEYNLHGNHTPTYFSQLVPRFADFQVLLVDRRDDSTVARGRTIPFPWDGTVAGLHGGIDEVGIAAVGATAPPSAMSALAAEVVAGRQGEGLSRLVLSAMTGIARAHGLDALVAPVRPSHKDRYPIIPIERYASWCRADGLPFDAWLRVHARIGGVIVGCAPRSLEITAPATSWTEWTGLEFPDDGTYVFPEGLAPLEVAAGIGTYFEPNVWVVHRVR